MSGNASPTEAATTRQTAHSASRPAYGRTRGTIAASGAGETGRRDRVTTGVASGVLGDGVVTSACRLPLAPQPQAQRVERLVHRAPRRALILQPLQERRRTLRARPRRRAQVVRRPHA